MRILYLTQWFEPEPAFKGMEFAERLAREGFEVEVATGFPNYPGGKLYPGHKLRLYKRERTSGGLLLHRLFLYPSHDQSSMRRALNYLSFFVSSLVFGLARGWRYDAVYVYHPPITPGLAMALIAKLYGTRFVLDIQDLWPDSVAASGMASDKAARILQGICRFVYRRADHLVVQADGMRDRLIERGVPATKITRIYNWATYARGAKGRKTDKPSYFSDAINVVYGGNLGQAQALEYVVEAIELARREVPGLRLHLFGDGIERAALLRKAQSCPSANVMIHDPVERQQMDRIFEAADILIMHLKRDPLYEFTIPSKTQHYMACAKPIVAGVSGEAASILQQCGGALVCPPEDKRAMAAALVRLGLMSTAEREQLGAKASRYYQTHFSVNSAIASTIATLTCPRSKGSSRPGRLSLTRPGQ